MSREYCLVEIDTEEYERNFNGHIGYHIEIRDDPEIKAKQVYFWIPTNIILRRKIHHELKNKNDIQKIFWALIRPWIEKKISEGITEESIQCTLEPSPVELLKYNPDGINQKLGEWVSINQDNSRKIVFISCGQRTQAERVLGKAIVELVRELTPFDPYFAEFQSSLQGVTQNIFQKLNEAVGLISVMHHRGKVKIGEEDVIRASVWIEQEIAIASFIEQVLGHPFYFAAFIEKNIELEGVRKYILGNPHPFQTDKEILEKLTDFLPLWVPPKNSVEGQRIEVEIEYKDKKITQLHHDYELQIYLHNKGQTKIDDFRLDVLIPRRILNPKIGFSAELPQKGTPTHRFFRKTSDDFPSLKIYSGDKELVMKLDYFINNEIFRTSGAFDEKLTATVWSGNMRPFTIEKVIRDLQKY